jgi:hypothetical protein
MEGNRRGNFVERNDWRVWAFLSVFFLFFAVEEIRMGGSAFGGEEADRFAAITDTSWDELSADDPGLAQLIDSDVRAAGMAAVAATIFSFSIAVFGLRRRQRWAWVTMWTWPLWFVLTWIMTPAPSTFAIVIWIIVLVITVALLALTYRQYAAQG